MAARKPRLEFYWTPVTRADVARAEGGLLANMNIKTVAGRRVVDHKVNWRLVGGNSEVMCQCTQGFRDAVDAMRNVSTVTTILSGSANTAGLYKIEGPGAKPKADGEK